MTGMDRHGARTLRFLVTDACNLRCTFCHNEFQGDLKRGRPSQWDMTLVHGLLAHAAGQGELRVKFSGGEPLLRWLDLTSLLGAANEFDARDITLFTNLTLASGPRLEHLCSHGVVRLNANLPSFRSGFFATRTGQQRSRLDLVLDNARIARGLGLRVQFNLVVPQFADEAAVRAFIQAELRAAREHRNAWDALSLVADDWNDETKLAAEEIAAILAGELGVERVAGHYLPRSQEFYWAGKTILATRCTDWSSTEETGEADIYIVPPGRVLSSYIRGRAYRL